MSPRGSRAEGYLAKKLQGMVLGMAPMHAICRRCPHQTTLARKPGECNVEVADVPLKVQD